MLSKLKKSSLQQEQIEKIDDALAKRILNSKKVTVLAVLGPILYNYRFYLIGALILNSIHGIAITFQNLAPKWLISDCLKPAHLTFQEKLLRAGLIALAYFFVSSVGRMLVWHASYKVFTWVRERLVFAIRHRFFRHVNHLCLRFHGVHPSGEIFNYMLGSPLQQFTQFYQHTSLNFAGAVLTIISTMAIISLWDPVLTGILIATALSSALIMNNSRKRIKALNKEYQKTEGHVSSTISDILRGNKAVKLYGMEEKVVKDFNRQALFLGEKIYEKDVKSHVEIMKHETSTYIAYSILIITATWRYLTGHADEGVVAAYLNSFTGIINPLSTILTSLQLWGGAQASIERIGTVLKTSSTIPDPEDSEAKKPQAGKITFDHVHFTYEEGHDPVFTDLHFEIPYGQKIALAGPSGSGKSTIAQLIIRLYDPQKGKILLNNVDLRSMKGTDIRKLFGIVPQDPFIFNASIRDNVKVSKPSATDDEVIDACKRANAWEFIEELPNKLDERAGEGGSTLSGGQRQRLAIARALLLDPPFYIFDEATSALDSLSEELIRNTLDNELGSATVVFIAHRLSTVRNCDRILVIDNGKILQDGTFAELTEQEGLFQELVQGQDMGKHLV